MIKPNDFNQRVIEMLEWLKGDFVNMIGKRATILDKQIVLEVNKILDLAIDKYNNVK